MKIDSETSRIRAALVNTGRYSISEADAKLAASCLSVFLGDDASQSVAGQAAFLTAVATAARCFGAVTVAGTIDVPLRVPLPVSSKTLRDAALALGAMPSIIHAVDRRVSIGSAARNEGIWEVRPYWDGWVAGVAPASEVPKIGRSDCALAGIAAGALAVGQAFLAEQGDLRAGRASHSISLWSPHLSWQEADNPGLGDIALPRSLWLVGLGNLGQAYLWSLFMLPYGQPKDVLLFLQDDDLVDAENWGTSILVEKGRYGVLKTRVAEEWCERREFQTRRIDRRLDAHLRRTEHEPGIALAGLDRMPGRRLLGCPKFDYVIDSGLGATAQTYRSFRLNVFDKAHDPARHFEGVEDRTDETVRELLSLPAYQELSRRLNDGGCGAATLAGKSVAAPFVSAFVATLAVTQAIRIASGEAYHLGLTGTAGDLRTIRAALVQE